MDQNQVKAALLEVEADVPEFSLVFSGKKSSKVNGLYKPDTLEIIIHNRNFQSDNELMYTAIHEFAHHVHSARSPVPVGPRAHTTAFRAVFHELLARAERLGIFANPFAIDHDLAEMSRRLREDFVVPNASLMKRFGAALNDAARVCEERRVRFEDFVERTLGISRATAQTVIRIGQYDIPESIGYEAMKTVASVADEEERDQMIRELREGQSPDQVKAAHGDRGKEEPDPLVRLEAERRRIERSIENLRRRLTDVESRIESLNS